jgi:hypothetical protein
VRLFARQAMRVASVALIVNDLERNAIHLGLIHAGKLLERSRLTHHDSVASVKRAYTAGELREMLSPYGRRLEITRNYLYRLGAILWK